jgi:outer membrane autotransporter protein
VSVQIGFAQNDYHGSRQIDFVTAPGLATSDYQGSELSAAVEGGHTFLFDGVEVRPMAGLSWTRLDQDGYTEQGGTGAELTVSGKTGNTLTSTLGVGAAAPFRTEALGTVTPSLDVRWGYDIVRQDGAINSRFAGSTGGSFTVAGNEPSRNAAIVAAGIAADLAMGISLQLGATGEFREGQQAYGVLGRVRYSW